jgi:hypothetical protein
MDSTTKKIVAVFVSVLLFVIFIYGSYLPYHKSKLYIDGSRKAQTATTLVDFEAAIGPSLDATSPIGQNELVRNLGSMILTVVRNAGTNKDLAKAAIDYLNSYYKPIMDYGKGPSFSQDLYILGLINESAYLRTQDASYLTAAEGYYKEGYARGPKRPQFLYGLFDVDRFKGDEVASKQITEEILSYWPDDQTIKDQYQKFLEKVASSTVKVNISTPTGQ